MLKIINPKGQKFHQSTIDAFLDLLSIYQDIELAPERKESATFLIAENHQHGVYGGAVLYPQRIYDLKSEELLEGYEDDFRGVFMTFQPHIQEFWITRIFFCLEADLSPRNSKEMALCKKFYDELYKAIVDFGHFKGIEFLPLSICSLDTLEMPFYREWPDSWPMRRSDDTSGLYHGILSLTGKRFLPKIPRKRSVRHDVCLTANKNGFEGDHHGRAA